MKLFDKILLTLGTNNSSQIVTGILALFKMIFIPMATLNDKKASPEQKKYTIMRDIITEALALATYIGVTGQVQKHATAPICSAYYKNKAKLIRTGNIPTVTALDENDLKFLETVDSKKLKEIGEHYADRLSENNNEISAETKAYMEKLQEIIGKINGNTLEKNTQITALADFTDNMHKKGISSEQKGLSFLFNDFKNASKDTIKVLNPEKLFQNTRIALSQVSVWILALAVIPPLCNLLITPVMKKYNERVKKSEQPVTVDNIIPKAPVMSKIAQPGIYTAANGNMRI